MKNTLDGFNYRLHVAEEKIHEFEDRAIKTIQNEKQIGVGELGKKNLRTSVSCGTTSNFMAS